MVRRRSKNPAAGFYLRHSGRRRGNHSLGDGGRLARDLLSAVAAILIGWGLWTGLATGFVTLLVTAINRRRNP
jgi:hypothetical protein